MKKGLQGWKANAFRSAGGAKAPITMSQFLGWIKKAQPKYAKGIETYARGDSAYAEHFAQAISKDGKQTSTASDDKVKVRKPHQAAGDGENLELEKDPTEPTDKQKEDDKAKATYKQMGDELEAKRIAAGGELVDEDEDSDETPAVSASIYETRLRELLEDEGVGVDDAKVLDDNQIDTLITMGIEKQIELDGGESIIDDPSDLSSSGVSEPAAQSAASDDFLGEYQDELEDVLTKVKTGGKDIDKRNQQSANNMLNSL
jgi:hypothetical protein